MVASAIGRVLVTMSLLVINPESDYTHPLSSVLSSVSNWYNYVTPKHTVSDTNDLAGLQIHGLILARKGSKGIPHKNVVTLHGHPLIHHALMAMIESNVFTKIWVSTDDPLVSEYVSELRKNASSIPIQIHNRAWYTATDEATSLLAVQEFLHYHPEIDVIGLVQATSPLVQPQFLTASAELMKSSNADSVFAVTRQYKFRWSAAAADCADTGTDAGKGNTEGTQWTQPLNFDPSARPRRQDWAGELVENGMFYFMTSKIVTEGLLQGKRSLYYEVPREYSLEIDSPEDLEYAELIMKKFEGKKLNSNSNCTTEKGEL